MRERRIKTVRKIAVALLLSVAFLLGGNYLLQRFVAHRQERFVPDYERVALSDQSDYETIFRQTGLSAPAVDRLLSQGDFQAILNAQELFFHPPEEDCAALLGWMTRRDLLESDGPALCDLRPGDVLITLSTHSLGWRHGHAGLVIDQDTVLECAVWGKNSACFSPESWTKYSNYAVLRLKDADPSVAQAAADYAMDNLVGVPYHISSGFIGPKAPDPDDWQFGLHCSYLVWYAYYQLGYDLDSDGGRLASSYDLLHSPLLDVVQIYGMDPRLFE